MPAHGKGQITWTQLWLDGVHVDAFYLLCVDGLMLDTWPTYIAL